MKRLFAIFLVVSLMLCSFTALADFNADIFTGIDNITTDIDDMEGVGYIDLVSHKPCFFETEYSEYYYSAFYPSIRINGSGVGVLRMFGSFYGDSWAFIDTIIIKIGRKLQVQVGHPT